MTGVAPEDLESINSIFPEQAPLFLTKAEEQQIAKLDSKIRHIEFQKTGLLRKFARKRGLISKTLKGLKSNCGKPYIEIDPEKHFSGYYQKAQVEDCSCDSNCGRECMPTKKEVAYFCAFPHIQRGGCGWVKGRPKEAPYRQPLVGGKKYLCRICEQEIADIITSLH